MHSPAPIQNGASYGMPMNNYNNGPQMQPQPQMPVHQMMGPAQTMRNPMMPPDDMMAGGIPNQYQGGYTNMPTPTQQAQPPSHVQQPMQNPNNYNLQMMNQHSNVMSPRPPSAHGQNQMMMQSQMPPQQPIMTHHQPSQQVQHMNYQQPPIQQQQQPPGIMSPHGVSSPHPNQMMPPYTQPGMSSHPPSGVPNQGPPVPPPPHMLHNQMIPNNNPNARVMSPLHQNNNGMIPPQHSVHHAMPPHHMHPNGPIPQQGMINRMPPGQMMPNMMPHQPQANMHNPNMIMNSQQNPQGAMMGPPGQNMPMQMGKIYASNQHMFNPQHPNFCGACNREIQGEIEEPIMCGGGCSLWFHRMCVGMSPEAYQFLKKEECAEWVCDNCIQSRQIAPVKFRI